MVTEKRKKGQKSEDLVALFLKRDGFTILDRNYNSRSGEIDIVAKKNDVFHFVEVKTIKSGDEGDLAEIVSKQKRRKICLAAISYAKEQNIMERSISFDVATVIDEEITMYYGAFLLGE